MDEVLLGLEVVCGNGAKLSFERNDDLGLDEVGAHDFGGVDSLEDVLANGVLDKAAMDAIVLEDSEKSISMVWRAKNTERTLISGEMMHCNSKRFK